MSVVVEGDKYGKQLNTRGSTDGWMSSSLLSKYYLKEPNQSVNDTPGNFQVLRLSKGHFMLVNLKTWGRDIMK